MNMKNRVILGDCLEKMKDIPNNSVDLIIADPPFMTTDLDFDKIDIDFNMVFNELKRVLKLNGWLFLFSPINLSCVALNSGWRNKFEYIWVKPAVIPATFNTIRPLTQHEIIRVMIKPELKRMTDLYFDKISLRTEGKPYERLHKKGEVLGEFAIKNRRIPMDKNNVKIEYNHKNDGYRAGSTVIYYPNKNRLKMNERTTHPTQKPVKMYELFIKSYCPIDGVVLDPFAGSGTTGVAAIKQNRNYILIEKEEKYYNIINERIEAQPQKLESFL